MYPSLFWYTKRIARSEYKMYIYSISTELVKYETDVTLFNIDGVCSRRNAGNQSEVGFGMA